MPIARITSLAPDGRPPYNSPNGLLYGHAIGFDNGSSGLVNTKSEVPPYRVGDEVQYEVKGKVGSKDKVTVKKTDQTQGYQARAAAPQSSSANSPIGTAVSPLPTIHGATVGLAVKEALILMSENPGPTVGTPLFWSCVHTHASDIIRLCNALEKGNLAPSASTRAKQANPEPAKDPVSSAGRADPAYATKRPPVGPDGSVDNTGADEDVPF